MKKSNWRSNLLVFTLWPFFLEAAVAQKEMKIISLYCLLVNLTSSSKKKKGEGCLGEMLFPDVFPVPDSRCNYSPALSFESRTLHWVRTKKSESILEPFQREAH